MCLKHCWMSVKSEDDPGQMPLSAASDLDLHWSFRPVCPNACSNTSTVDSTGSLVADFQQVLIVQNFFVFHQKLNFSGEKQNFF